MFSNFWDRFANGFMFGMLANSGACCFNTFYPNTYFYNYSSPYIPSVDRNLLNSVFDLSLKNNCNKKLTKKIKSVKSTNFLFFIVIYYSLNLAIVIKDKKQCNSIIGG